jgi:hypothetical protein
LVPPLPNLVILVVQVALVAEVLLELEAVLAELLTV